MPAQQKPAEFMIKHPDHISLTYIYGTAAAKAYACITVTSLNVKYIID